MTPSSITPSVALPDPTGSVTGSNDPERKRTQSSQDFEALLIGQMLHAVRDEDSGWLGSGDEASDAAFGLGEEQLAQAIAQGGGFGLGKFIDKALARETASKTG